MQTITSFLMTPEEARNMIIEIVTEAVKTLREDRWLTRREAMDLLGKSSTTLYRMVQQGILKEYYIKNGGHPRYKYSEVMQIKNLK